MPKVSALTSIYKSDKYLDGYIKNVKKQKFKDFDIHIDLNKPSGNELEKLTQFSNNHERINLNVSKRLKSMSASWNTCIINSDSEYICLWNVDDKRSKNSLKIMSEVLDNNKKIDIVNLIFFFLCVLESGFLFDKSIFDFYTQEKKF